MARDRVVAGRNLEVEPGREDVLGEHLAGPAGNRKRQRDARDRAVLNALRAGRADQREAPRLEIEHRLAFGLAHQRLRAPTGGEPNLHAARGVGRGEQGLRPRRVVSVDEHRFGPVHRQCLRVGDETLDRESQVQALLDRALGHHAGAPGLRADQQGDRVQRRIPRDADGRLELGEAPRGCLGRVGGQQRRVFLQVRHMCLVRGRASCSELLQGEHQLDRVEHRDHPREPGRGQAA